MAYYSLHAYDADVRIPEFRGLRQCDDIASDLRFAINAENVETPNGVLQPMAGETFMEGQFDAKVETIARFHRRWYTGGGSNEWLVCAAGGQLYCRQVGDNIGWVKIRLGSSIGSFQCNVWSWVTYEQNLQGIDHPVDVLIISNAKDGMYMIIPPDRPTTWGDVLEYTWQDVKEMNWEEVYSEKWSVVDITPTIDNKEYKFGVIERFKERIWGAAIDGEPDMLMYSAPYDPTDWEANTEIPEDGAGDILLPSWDGDKFTALRAFGDQLIAFKGRKVWRVMGTSPDDFTFSEQYGGGTLYPNTIAVDRERILLVEKDGISVYDGMTVTPFNRVFIEKFWKTVNQKAMDQMSAALFKDRYYLSLPTGTSEVNNALIVYNSVDGTFLLYTDVYYEALMEGDDVLYATSATLPGRVMEIQYNSWETGVSSGKGAKWETPWMDFNYKTIAKGGYEIYFNPEVKKYPVTFRFSIQTEKKTKTKIVVIQPTVAQSKQKRIRFGGTSRRFKLIIEALPVPTGAIWRLTGGIHMVVETDPD